MMKFNSHSIKNFSTELREKCVGQVTLCAALGMSFVLFTPNASDFTTFKNVQTHGLTSTKNDIVPSEKVCVGCNRPRPLGEFASKGKGRKGSLCKPCDNHRRRSSYESTSKEPDWDNLAVIYERSPNAQTSSLAVLIFELLRDQHLIEMPKQKEEVDISDLIRTKSVIDQIM